MDKPEDYQISFEEVAALTLALVLIVSEDNEDKKNFIVDIAESIKAEMFPDATK